MNKQFKTPILFLIFNRPDTTQRVFKAISRVKPKQLFVVADGPRLDRDGEKQLCKATREIINHVDWDCEVKTLFRDKNLGCKIGVSLAINWFFKNVEEGIILEDDCLPNESFFLFCEELLKKYRNNNKIYMISGNNFLPQKLRLNQDYYFSRLPHIWGWATWRRAWSYYDANMADFPEFIEKKSIEDIWKIKNVQKYWLNIFSESYKGNIDTWDYQWSYAVWKKGGVSIAPGVNLVSNIGFGSGTHTLNKKDKCANLSTESIKFPLKNNPFIIYSKGDDYENKYIFLRTNFFKKILKFLGLFKIVRKIYHFLK